MPFLIPIHTNAMMGTRTALRNAASIAGLMLTTEAMIADAPDEQGDGGMGGMGGMGMGM